jgi:glycosyltransferase involved in cell wall biosynthesis
VFTLNSKELSKNSKTNPSTMGSLKRLSFIVPAYNEEKLLPTTLSNLQQLKTFLTDYNVRIVVVDNNSTDNTSQLAKDLGANVLFEPINSIAKARNCGAKYCSDDDYLIFVDADTIVPLALVESALKNLDTLKASCGGALIEFNSEGKKPSKIFTQSWTLIAKLTNLTAGAFIYCTVEAYKNAGGFNEKLYAGEDVFFSREVKKWARRNRKPPVRLIAAPPIITSSRKFQWYSNWSILWIFIKISLCPWMIRKKDSMKFWYDRPEDKKTDGVTPEVRGKDSQ